MIFGTKGFASLCQPVGHQCCTSWQLCWWYTRAILVPLRWTVHLGRKHIKKHAESNLSSETNFLSLFQIKLWLWSKPPKAHLRLEGKSSRSSDTPVHPAQPTYSTSTNYFLQGRTEITIVSWHCQHGSTESCRYPSPQRDMPGDVCLVRRPHQLLERCCRVLGSQTLGRIKVTDISASEFCQTRLAQFQQGRHLPWETSQSVLACQHACSGQGRKLTVFGSLKCNAVLNTALLRWAR